MSVTFSLLPSASPGETSPSVDPPDEEQAVNIIINASIKEITFTFLDIENPPF